MHFIILRHVFVFLNVIFIVTAFFICEQDGIDQGFCHQQDVKIAVNLNCSVKMNASLYVSSVPQRTSTVQNYNLQCPLRIGNALQCLGEAMKGTHNAINDTLDITFTFNNTMYAGHYLRIIGYCYDKKDVENILLKPCGKYKIKHTWNLIMS